MWILLSSAIAGELDCRRCCEKAGVGECEVSLRAYGPESKLSQDRGGWRVDGVYVIGCDGRGWFDNSRVVYLMDEPQSGELAMPESDPAAIDCFQVACALPRDLTLTTASGRRAVRSTVTGAAPDRMAYRRAPGAVAGAATIPTPVVSPSGGTPTAAAVTGSGGGTQVNGSSATVVVIEGQTIYAQRTPTPVVTPTAAAPASSLATAVVTDTEPPARIAIAVAVPVAAPVPVAGGDVFAAGLPPDPPAECYASDGNRAAAGRAQVMAGDDRRILGDHIGAVSAYRAAVTLDQCSAYGWVGLGQSALALNRPDLATRALVNATRLMPAHYGAWVELGRAYEGIQQKVRAHAAYEEALARQPNHAEANAGWRRTLP